MQNNNLLLVSDFIEQIWNNRNFDKLDDFIHFDYKDNSLPDTFPANEEGLKKWIVATSASFKHKTTIEDHVSEGDKIILKIRMMLEHTGSWRGIDPTGMEVTIQGYRFYKLKEGKIIESWALVDGQALESQLKGAINGCKPAV